VVAAILPVLAVATYSSFELQRDSRQESKDALVRDLSYLSSQQSLLTENTRLLLSTVSKLEIARHPDPAALRELFASILSENPLYVAMLAFSPEGKIVAANAPTGSIDISDRNYYADLMRFRKFTVGAYAISRSTGRPTLHFAYPVFKADSDALACILVASYDLACYGSLFGTENLGEDATVEVFDRYGVRLFRHPEDADRPVGVPAAGEIGDLASGRRPGEGVAIRQSGSLISASLVLDQDSNPAPDFLMVMSYPQRIMDRAVRGVILRSILMLLSSLALSYVLVRVLAYYAITAQLDALVAAARRFGSGDFGRLAGISSGSEELMALGESLDEMAKAIGARRRERDDAERALRASLSEKDVLLKEIHHRVKNNFQIISSLLNLQAETISDAAALEAFNESQNRIKSMALIHEKLYQSESLGGIDFSDYVGSMLEELAYAYHARLDKVRVETDLERIELPIDSAIPLGLILNELITNAFKYAFPGSREGRILISLKLTGEASARLTVEDDGVGMDAGNTRSGNLGMDLVKALAAQLRGELEAESDGGTRWTVRFPLKA
jgi:two-component sensor histidine kinase